MIGGERRMSLDFHGDHPEDPPREGDWIRNFNTGTTYEIISEVRESPSFPARYYFDRIRLDQWAIPESDIRVWGITYSRR